MREYVYVMVYTALGVAKRENRYFPFRELFAQNAHPTLVMYEGLLRVCVSDEESVVVIKLLVHKRTSHHFIYFAMVCRPARLGFKMGHCCCYCCY